MIDKPDPKDAGRTDSPKRPHATIDVKSTEVKPATPVGGASPSAPSSTASSSSSAASASTPPAGSAASGSGAFSAGDKKSDASSTAAAPQSSKPSATPGADGKPAAPKASTLPKTEIPVEPRQSGGGFFSHLAAGLVGGGLVYAASALGLAQLVTPGDGAPDLAQRVAALEATPKESSNASDLNARVQDAESRLAKLSEIEERVVALSEGQNALQSETKALGEAARNAGDQGSADRIAKVEEQLRLIASGAPQGDGRIPQLAALAGKITDLEAALQTQIASLRKSVPAEVDERIAQTAEASEAAKAATQRLDREMATARTEQARGLQKVETQKAETDRLTAAVEAVKEETGRLSSVVADLRGSIDSQLKAVARPADVSNAVNPVYSKIAEIEQNVQGVIKSEESRRENAGRIVLSLELSGLKRALDRGEGQGYAAELDSVRKASEGQIDLSALERFKDTGVATIAQLKEQFRPVMNAILDADSEPVDGSVIDRLLAGAKSVVRVRKVSHDTGDTSTEAVVARIEEALDDGRLGDIIALAKTLPQKARGPIEDWLIKVTARNSVDQAIAQIDDRLKASLSGTPEPAPAPAPPQAQPAAPAPVQK